MAGPPWRRHRAAHGRAGRWLGDHVPRAHGGQLRGHARGLRARRGLPAGDGDHQRHRRQRADRRSPLARDPAARRRGAPDRSPAPDPGRRRLRAGPGRARSRHRARRHGAERRRRDPGLPPVPPGWHDRGDRRGVRGRERRVHRAGARPVAPGARDPDRQQLRPAAGGVVVRDHHVHGRRGHRDQRRGPRSRRQRARERQGPARRSATCRPRWRRPA